MYHTSYWNCVWISKPFQWSLCLHCILACFNFTFYTHLCTTCLLCHCFPQHCCVMFVQFSWVIPPCVWCSTILHPTFAWLPNSRVHPLNDNQLDVHYNYCTGESMFIEDRYKTNTCRVLVYLVFHYHTAAVVSDFQSSWYSNAGILDVERLFFFLFLLSCYTTASCMSTCSLLLYHPYQVATTYSVYWFNCMN